ncbi:MAG: SDR family oxidoreductase [Methylococcales symbiont of Hymedesmia sp. n. MRB-2018]|nr:MAG: SDR family oxidoreductase [Methylococcales symbiont of Hymedesmia sp. n. MRB-2018]
MYTLKRTLLVTGASSGIGRAIAKSLLMQGHHVIGSSRDCNQFTKAHAYFHPFEINFSHLDEIAPKMKQLQKKFPALDAIIFAAGFGQFGALEEFSYPQIELLLTVNLTSQIFLTRSLIPQLKRKKHSNLIYIGSEAALKGSRKGAVYCASKFALRGFTQALKEECGNSSVRVSLINPGMVKTAFFEDLNFQAGNDPSHALLADDIAETVNYILKSNPNSVIDEINLNPANKVIRFKKGAYIPKSTKPI